MTLSKSIKVAGKVAGKLAGKITYKDLEIAYDAIRWK